MIGTFDTEGAEPARVAGLMAADGADAPVQTLARAYLRSASPAEREAVRRAAENAPASLPEGLVAGSRWARAYSGCVGSVTAFHDTAELAASIALDLRVDSGLDDVRSQLDQLAAQAPHLRRQS